VVAGTTGFIDGSKILMDEKDVHSVSPKESCC
jgi:hypothetical protein